MPVPSSVVSGPFRPTLFRRMESSALFGNGSPSFCIAGTPISWMSHSIATPVASMARRVAATISGPVPSPGMRVMRCVTGSSPVADRCRGASYARDLSIEQTFDTQVAIEFFYTSLVELGQLEAFVEAQRRGSITRAAEALDLTQPTVTARLRGLEKELGTPLLVRARRGVSLTAAGRRFLPRAMAALEAVRRGVADTRSARDARGGFLTLGLASDLALYLAPAALARFARTHPDVEVTVRSGRSRAVAEALRADEIEIALVSQLIVLPELASRPLFTEDVPVVVGRGHAFAKRARVAAAD